MEKLFKLSFCEKYLAKIILSDFCFEYFKSVNIFNRKRQISQGYVNNQITDWSFKVDGILHNVSQDSVYDHVVKEIALNTLEGYNGSYSTSN